jgi:hypothetical protein
MTSYEIHLEGVHAHDLSLGVLRDLADLLVEGTTRAVRLAAEGRSIARGSAPAWLADAAELRLTELREGSLTLQINANPLAELAPSIFAAGAAEASLSAAATSFDLLMGAMDDAVHGKRDSERLDFGMLQTLMKCRTVFGRGATRLRFTRGGGASIELGEAAIGTFQRLAAEIPVPGVQRLVGLLDSVTLSTRTVVVKLDDGLALKGSLGVGVDIERAKELLGMDVLLEGLVSFHPSGRPRRIDIDYMAIASARDVVWRRSPLGERGAQLPLPSDELTAQFGLWPGEEDDDRVFAALKEMS